MDMKRILQAFDNSSSKPVEGASDMKRFISAVQVLNKPLDECSGYIPKNEKEAKDPRWTTALSVDVQPGAIEKNLKALSLAEGRKSFKDYLKEAEQDVAEYGDTAKGQKMLTKVQKRAVDRVTSKKADTDPVYAKKNKDTADRAWDRMTDKDLEEGLKDPKDNPCWKGYKPVGTKKKNGKTVPNCVPKE